MVFNTIEMLRVVFALSVITCVSGFPGFQQNGYKIIYERSEVIDYNRDYFSNVVINNFKYNRTQAVSNMTYTMIRDIPSRLKFQVEAFKFASNEYRGFPIQFSYSFCQGLLRDDFGLQEFLKCGNLTSANLCPVAKKGPYRICNFKPNDEKFPPNVPEGSYMVDIKFFHGPTEIVFAQSYVTIKNKSWL